MGINHSEFYVTVNVESSALHLFRFLLSSGPDQHAAFQGRWVHFSRWLNLFWWRQAEGPWYFTLVPGRSLILYIKKIVVNDARGRSQSSQAKQRQSWKTFFVSKEVDFLSRKRLVEVLLTLRISQAERQCYAKGFLRFGEKSESSGLNQDLSEIPCMWKWG